MAKVPAGAVIVMLRAFVVLPAELVACTVKLKVPGIVGFPDITPALERLSPAGRLPDDMLQVMGVVPVAARVWL
jgi:hypothetical protein